MVIKIQSVIRMFISKRRVKRMLLEKKKPKLYLFYYYLLFRGKKDFIVVKIQALWRGHIGRRVVRLLRQDIFNESIELYEYKEHLKLKPLADEVHNKELSHLYKEKVKKNKEENKPRNEIKKHYIRPGLETPSYYLRTLPRNPNAPYNNDLSKLDLDLVYKIRYDYVAHSQIKRNMQTVPTTDRWCMRQNGYEITNDGKIVHTKEYNKFHEENSINISEESPIPLPNHICDFKKNSQCIIILYNY